MKKFNQLFSSGPEAAYPTTAVLRNTAEVEQTKEKGWCKAKRIVELQLAPGEQNGIHLHRGHKDCLLGAVLLAVHTDLAVFHVLDVRLLVGAHANNVLVTGLDTDTAANALFVIDSFNSHNCLLLY